MSQPRQRARLQWKFKPPEDGTVNIETFGEEAETVVDPDFYTRITKTVHAGFELGVIDRARHIRKLTSKQVQGKIVYLDSSFNCGSQASVPDGHRPQGTLVFRCKTVEENVAVRFHDVWREGGPVDEDGDETVLLRQKYPDGTIDELQLKEKELVKSIQTPGMSVWDRPSSVRRTQPDNRLLSLEKLTSAASTVATQTSLSGNLIVTESGASQDGSQRKRRNERCSSANSENGRGGNKRMMQLPDDERPTMDGSSTRGATMEPAGDTVAPDDAIVWFRSADSVGPPLQPVASSSTQLLTKAMSLADMLNSDDK